MHQLSNNLEVTNIKSGTHIVFVCEHDRQLIATAGICRKPIWKLEKVQQKILN